MLYFLWRQHWVIVVRWHDDMWCDKRWERGASLLWWCMITMFKMLMICLDCCLWSTYIKYIHFFQWWHCRFLEGIISVHLPLNWVTSGRTPFINISTYCFFIYYTWNIDFFPVLFSDIVDVCFICSHLFFQKWSVTEVKKFYLSDDGGFAFVWKVITSSAWVGIIKVPDASEGKAVQAERQYLKMGLTYCS